MNRNLVIILVIVALVTVGLWVWMSSREDVAYIAPAEVTDTNTDTAAGTNAPKSNTNTASTPNTFQSIITQKGVTNVHIAKHHKVVKLSAISI